MLRFIFALGFIYCAVAGGSVPNPLTEIDHDAGVPVSEPEDKIINKKNINAFVPADLTPTSDVRAFESEFQRKFGQRTIDRFFDSDFFKKTPAGHAVEKLKTVTEKSIALSTPHSASEKPQELKFKLLAFEKQAMVFYSGFIDSKLVYFMDMRTAEWDLTKSLGLASHLTLSSIIGEEIASKAGIPNISSRLIFDYNF